MKHFLIITNAFKDKDLKLTNEIKKYIEAKGGTCSCYINRGDDAAYAAPDEENIPEGTECALVLGGDGSLIRAASKLRTLDIALIGVNLGTLGYLCELEETNLFPAIDELMEDHYVTENRMMLCGHALKQGRRMTGSHVALNDVVIHRAGALSIVRLIVSVNGEYLNTFRADGIIISTPTGSTGYNMSAGGPIVDPKAQMILITPINDHNLNSRSIVIGADDEVTIEIGKRRSQKDETVEVSFDGDNAIEMEVGDKLIVRKASSAAKICKLSNVSFLEILRKKMQAYT